MKNEKKLYIIGCTFTVEEGNGSRITDNNEEIKFEATREEAEELYKHFCLSKLINRYEEGSLFLELDDALSELENGGIIQHENSSHERVEEIYYLNEIDKDYMNEADVLKKTKKFAAQILEFIEKEGVDLED